MPTTKKPVVYGTTWIYCDNSACPVREVILHVKDDHRRGAGDHTPAGSVVEGGEQIRWLTLKSQPMRGFSWR